MDASAWKRRWNFLGLACISKPLFVLLVQLFHPPLVFLQSPCKAKILKKGITKKAHDKMVSYCTCVWPSTSFDNKTDGRRADVAAARVRTWLPSCNCCSCLFRDASLSWYILEQIIQMFISIHSAVCGHSKLYSSKDSFLFLNAESCFLHLLLFDFHIVILIMFGEVCFTGIFCV